MWKWMCIFPQTPPKQSVVVHLQLMNRLPLHPSRWDLSTDRVHVRQRKVHPEAVGVRPRQRLRGQFGRVELFADQVQCGTAVCLLRPGLHLEEVGVWRSNRLPGRSRWKGILWGLPLNVNGNNCNCEMVFCSFASIERTGAAVERWSDALFFPFVSFYCVVVQQAVGRAARKIFQGSWQWKDEEDSRLSSTDCGGLMRLDRIFTHIQQVAFRVLFRLTQYANP